MEWTKKDLMVRILLGAVLGAVLAPLPVLWLGSALVADPGAAAPSGWAGLSGLRIPVTPAMAQAYGAFPALLLQSLLGALLGALVLASTLPFADSGRALVLSSLAHFCATAAAFALLLGVCRWVDGPEYILIWVGLLLVFYLLIWLGRYVGWYMEVRQLRVGLGLDPGPSALRWRETLPYLPFLVLLCGLLPVLARLCDPADVPVFSGLLLPYLLLPLAGLCSGVSLGKHQGFCPLYPVLAFLLYLPMVFLLFNSSAMFHCFLVSGAALVGNGLGTLLRGRRRSR